MIKRDQVIKTMLSTVAVACALAAVTGLAAAGAKKLRWVAPEVMGETSGAPIDKTKNDWVRINKTFSTKPQDRMYAIKGITIYGKNGCGIKALPAFIHPGADKNPRNDRFGCTEPGKPKKTVELPAGYVMTGLQVCDNGKGGWSKQLKGIRIWGHKLSDTGRPIQPKGPFEIKRSGCKKWRSKVTCPTGKIVTSFNSYAPKNSSIKLRCAKAEKAN